MVYYFRTLFFFTFELGSVIVWFPCVKLLELCGFGVVPILVCRAERLSCSFYASTLLFSVSFPCYNVLFLILVLRVVFILPVNVFLPFF